jgi:hypothetical protein
LYGCPTDGPGVETRNPAGHATPAVETAAPLVDVREASRVERLAYTRTQAAEALGIGRSTFIRRVLPYVATIEMPWGARLIPVDELQRLLAEHRRVPSTERRPTPRRGRRATTLPDTAARIRSDHMSGKSLGEIARHLNADGVPTAQGGRKWWPSTVRAVLVRTDPPETTHSSSRQAMTRVDPSRR